MKRRERPTLGFQALHKREEILPILGVVHQLGPNLIVGDEIGHAVAIQAVHDCGIEKATFDKDLDPLEETQIVVNRYPLVSALRTATGTRPISAGTQSAMDGRVPNERVVQIQQERSSR